MDESVTTVTSSLLTRARNFDDAAWQRLNELYSPLIYGWCRRVGLSPECAADVGQMVWLAVVRSLSHYQHNNFRGWLREITKNKIRDYWKTVVGPTKRKPLPLVELEEVFDRPAPADLAEETRLLYRRVIDWIRGEFADSDWLAFCYLVVEEREPSEVAEQLGLTRNQVYLAKSRILRRVREEFGGLKVGEVT